MDIEVSLVQAMRFRARLPGGIEMELDAGRDVGGEGTAPTPVMAQLAALGACGGMDVISILRKMRADVRAYSLRLHGDRATEHPKVFTAITMTHVVTGDAAEHQVRRAATLSAQRYCPIFAMLSPGVPITIKYEIRGEAGEVRAGGSVDPDASPE